MTQIWYQEELVPSNEWLEEAERVKSNSKGPLSPVVLPRTSVRLHTPVEKVLDASAKIHFRRPGSHYVCIKLGCEFDPGEEARAANFGYVSAKFEVHCSGEGSLQPRVEDLLPVELNKGTPDKVKLKLEPALVLVSGAAGSLGSIEGDLTVGQVAPIVRGFKGEAERAPYWNLEHHHEAPLYGLRNFWILLELPQKLHVCYLIPFVSATMQARFGPILLEPKIKQIAHRPRYKIVIEPAA